MTGHRVDRQRERRAPQPLPKGEYRGATFVDTDGTAYEVVALPSHDWPYGGHSSLRADGKLHLRGGQS
jgi:hypothetical protein